MKDINDLSLDDKTIHIGKTDFISSLKDFFSFVDLGNKLSIPELKGKNIADIGSGFSDNMFFLSGILGNSSKIICIDGIYNDEYIKLGLEKAINGMKDRTKLLINEFEDSNVGKNEITYNRLLNNNNTELDFLQNWEKKEGILYKEELDKSDNIDVAFCKNLFYKIEEPVIFISEILEKLNDNGELFIIDYDNLGQKNIKLLRRLKSYDIIEGNVSTNTTNEYVIYKIKKENFIKRLREVHYIYSEINKEYNK